MRNDGKNVVPALVSGHERHGRNAGFPTSTRADWKVGATARWFTGRCPWWASPFEDRCGAFNANTYSSAPKWRMTRHSRGPPKSRGSLNMLCAPRFNRKAKGRNHFLPNTPLIPVTVMRPTLRVQIPLARRKPAVPFPPRDFLHDDPEKLGALWPLLRQREKLLRTEFRALHSSPVTRLPGEARKETGIPLVQGGQLETRFH